MLAENSQYLRCPPGIRFIRFVGMGEMGYMFLPYCCQGFIRSPDFILSDDSPDQVSIAVMDQHAIAAKIPAYRGAGWIDRASKTGTFGIFQEECTFFFRVV